MVQSGSVRTVQYTVAVVCLCAAASRLIGERERERDNIRNEVEESK
jgi:hypothetical protein